MSNKIIVTDDEAVEVLQTSNTRKPRQATKFVTRTIVYPVVMEYKPGIFTKEVRTFVQMYSYCSPRQWEQALELEKKFPKLQKAYRKGLTDRKLPLEVKEPGNPYKATFLNDK